MNNRKMISLFMAVFLMAAGVAGSAQARELSKDDVDAAVLAAHEARQVAQQAMLNYRDCDHASHEEMEKAKLAAKAALTAARKASKEAADMVREYTVAGIS